MKSPAKYSYRPPVKKPRPAKFWPVIGFATLAGMRSMSAPALLTHFLSHHPAKKLKNTSFRWLQKPGVATAFKLFAAGEFVGDKLPDAPDRTAPNVLAGRAIAGGLVGAAWYKANKGSTLGGAIIGSLGAVAATYLTLLLRKGVSEKTDTPIALVGVGEDALVWSAGAALLNGLAPKGK